MLKYTMNKNPKEDIMKLYARIIAMLCALLMLAACFTGCANTTDPETSTAPAKTQSPGESDAVTPDDPDAGKYDKDGYLIDDIPDELNYNEIVTILNWKAERVEFEVLEEETGVDMVKDAVYNRNIAAEERLGVTFEWTEEEGNNTNRKKFLTHVQNCYNGGTFYDIIATYSRTSAMLCTNGLLEDINAIDDNYINTNQPWWPKSMLDTCSIDDSLFFVSGDISTNILHFMYSIYYNMDLLQNLQLEDPVALVDNKTWTLDKLIEMSSGLYDDTDQSGNPTGADRYGFCSSYFHLDAFYSGSDMKLVEDDPDGILRISDDFFSQKSIDLADKLGAWFDQGDCYVSKRDDKFDEDEPFIEGNAVFIQNRVYLADAYYQGNTGPMRNVDWEFGILPTPLYDENQEDYITLLGNPFTHWCIMREARNPSMSTAVIESLCSEGYRKTSPALFENNMKFRYTPDSANKGDSSRMFDIIRENISFDLGRMFAAELNYISEKPLRAALSNQSWATVGTQNVATLNKLLVSLNKGLENAFE